MRAAIGAAPPRAATDPGRSGSPAQRGGYTLIELLVVMAIIGLVVGTVTVSVESLVPGERLNTSIRELAADLMTVRAEAVTRNMEYRMEYDLENARYRIATPYRAGGGRIVTRDDPADEEQRYYTPWTELQPGVAFKKVVVGGEEYFQDVVYVRFDPLGSASDHFVILTQPEYDNAFTIEVMALTGLIRMHDGEFYREPPEDGDFD